ncbi:MAG: GerMN domain-containing protein [Actinomycetota bacterium]|jgi:hypothetical protein|nr:GerMN domain-containing protein [Actinomycetota bacterium]
MRTRALVAAAALLAGACGVPQENSPSAVEVPSDVFPEGFGSTDLPLPDGINVTEHPVYFLRDGLLVEKKRPLPTPVLLKAPLDNLLEGPTEQEAESGLVSVIPPGTEIQVTQLEDNIIRLGLNEAFFELEGELLKQATAQLVFTAYGLVRDPQGVTFFRVINGSFVALPKGDGTIEEVLEGAAPLPLTTSDFSNLVPRPVPLPPLPLPEFTGGG